MSSTTTTLTTTMTTNNNNNKIINMAVKSILYEQQKNGGRVPHGLIRDIIKDLQAKNIHVTRDTLNGRLRRYQLKEREREKESLLAAAENDGSTTMIDETSADTRNKSTDDGTCIEKKCCGSPQEATPMATHELVAAKKRLINEVAIVYSAKLNGKTNTKSRLPKGYLQNLVEAKRKELQIPKDVKISLQTIQNRRYTKSLTPQHRGTPSPLQELDKLILPTVMEMARTQKQMRPLEIVALVNKLIEGTVHQTNLVAWKKKHEPHQSGEQLGKVGMGYFNRFRKRYGKFLASTESQEVYPL